MDPARFIEALPLACLIVDRSDRAWKLSAAMKLVDTLKFLALGPALLAYLCEAAPGIRLRLHSTDRLQILDELDADRIDLGIGIGRFLHGQTHHKQRLLRNDTYLCMFNASRVGLSPPISLEDYVRLQAARDELWARFSTAAPQRLRQSVAPYSGVKRA